MGPRRLVAFGRHAGEGEGMPWKGRAERAFRGRGAALRVGCSVSRGVGAANEVTTSETARNRGISIFHFCRHALVAVDI